MLRAARDVLVPPRCAGCGAAGDWFCHECRDLLEPATAALTPAVRVRGAGAYEGPLRLAIHRLKYAGERGLAAELGDLVGRLVAADLARGRPLDVLVAVPLHPARAASRGYDQAVLLTRRASELVGLPWRPALHRIRSGRPQVELGRRERIENLRGAFVAEADALRGLRVGLLDDVSTTGATLRAAAAAVRAAGARTVAGYVVAIDE
ncbi:MAG: ComF family protein [Chloroflexota bacterium]|nr:ComF family protein [Chloroflexota bacterium]